MARGAISPSIRPCTKDLQKTCRKPSGTRLGYAQTSEALSSDMRSHGPLPGLRTPVLLQSAGSISADLACYSPHEASCKPHVLSLEVTGTPHPVFGWRMPDFPSRMPLVSRLTTGIPNRASAPERKPPQRSPLDRQRQKPQPCAAFLGADTVTDGAWFFSPPLRAPDATDGPRAARPPNPCAPRGLDLP